MRIPIFVCFGGSLVNTWRVIVPLDLYTHNRFSESMGSRFGGPGQKALQAMNEFALFGFLPCSFDVHVHVSAKNL